MKENDIVSLTKVKPEYKNGNLYESVNGIVLKSLPFNQSLVLFLNDEIVGDYAVAKVDNGDLKKEDVKLPQELINRLKASGKLNKIDFAKKQAFRKLRLHECDTVELVTEKEEYIKYGIHKSERGIIAINYSVNDKILVDFSGIDEKGNYYGDCIAVKIDDLKLIKRSE